MGVLFANSQVPQILSSRRALLLEDAHGLGQDMDANELLDLGSWEVGSHGEMSEWVSQKWCWYLFIPEQAAFRKHAGESACGMWFVTPAEMLHVSEKAINKKEL